MIKNRDTPFNHPRQCHPCDPDRGTDINCDNIREFRGLGFRKVHRVCVRLSNVIDYANGLIHDQSGSNDGTNLRRQLECHSKLSQAVPSRNDRV